MTKQYTGTKTTAIVDMDGECYGYNAISKTCVRRTTSGNFAVISTTGDRLIKLFDKENSARQFNLSLT